jgi:hypothetical protein
MSGNPHVVTSIRCAGPNCQAVRKEANHWFLVTLIEKSEGVDAAFYCRALEPDDLQPEEKPVCGQACAQKIFEHWLATAGTQTQVTVK